MFCTGGGKCVFPIPPLSDLSGIGYTARDLASCEPLMTFEEEGGPRGEGVHRACRDGMKLLSFEAKVGYRMRFMKYFPTAKHKYI